LIAAGEAAGEGQMRSTDATSIAQMTRAAAWNWDTGTLSAGRTVTTALTLVKR
jgi:hypothetical protein